MSSFGHHPPHQPSHPDGAGGKRRVGAPDWARRQSATSRQSDITELGNPLASSGSASNNATRSRVGTKPPSPCCPLAWFHCAQGIPSHNMSDSGEVICWRYDGHHVGFRRRQRQAQRRGGAHRVRLLARRLARPDDGVRSRQNHLYVIPGFPTPAHASRR